MRLTTHIFKLPFIHPFITAHGLKTHQPALVAGLSQGPHTGWGEAPAIAYYGASAEGMMELLEQHRTAIERYALTDPRRFWHFLHHLLPADSNALGVMAALDTAAWQLTAALRRQSLKMALGFGGRPFVPTDYTLGHDTAEAMLAKAAEKPWPIYKIKMTGAADISAIEKLRTATSAPFRVDANESLNYEDARRLLPDLQRLGVTILEQALPRGAYEEAAALKAQSPIPLFADEACHTEKDVAICAAGYHGIVVKLTKCGGITPALRMLESARSLGLKTMIGSMNESSVGARALVHLACGADCADTDGPLLLDEGGAEGVLQFDESGMPVDVPRL